MPKKDELKIVDLHVSAEGNEILKGINLVIRSGEIHAVMGPNGSGKSSLCNSLMGHPFYKITKGKASFNGKNILELSPDERAKLGLFLGFQYPREVSGVTFGNFLRTAVNNVNKSRQKNFKSITPVEFYKSMQVELKELKMDAKLVGRSLNDCFSGGEKKKAEVLQMSVLKPKMAFLDEIDSGLDIDALKYATSGIKRVFKKTGMGLLIVTHYQRILKYITPDFVHVIKNGKIVDSGGPALAKKLEKLGYEKY